MTMPTTRASQSYWIRYITSILVFMASQSFGGLLYGTERDGTLFTVDTTTETYTEVATFDVPAPATDLAYDCVNDKMYVSQGGNNQGLDATVVVEMNMADGSNIRSVDVSGIYQSLEYVDSTLYGWNCCDDWDNGLRILDPVTGTGSIISSGLDFSRVAGLAYDVETNTMYGTTAQAQESRLLRIDLDAGAVQTVVPTGMDAISSLAFGDNGILYGGTSGNNWGQIYKIDTDNGDIELFMDIQAITGGDKNGNAFDISGLTWVNDHEGCRTKQPTVSPSVAPTQSTFNPTKSPTKSPTTDDNSESNSESNDDAE